MGTQRRSLALPRYTPSMSLWVADPVTKQPSVSLTLLVLSTVLMVAGASYETFREVKSSDLLLQLFYTAVGLYWGRKNLSFNGKQVNLGSDAAAATDATKPPEVKGK